MATWHPRQSGETAYPIEATLERLAESVDDEISGGGDEDTGWVPLTIASPYGGGTLEVRRKNGFVSFYGMFTFGSASNGDAITTIPAGYRPDRELFEVFATTSTTLTAQRVVVATNGAVQANWGGSPASGNAIRFILSWPAP